MLFANTSIIVQYVKKIYRKWPQEMLPRVVGCRPCSSLPHPLLILAEFWARLASAIASVRHGLCLATACVEAKSCKNVKSVV